MTDDFVYIEITCKKCGSKFHPYGYTRVKPPVFGNYKCSCGHVNRVIFDPEIKRELARKDLRLPDVKAEFSTQIKAMQAEIDSLRARLDEQQGCMKDLTKRLDILIPEVRKQVAQAITEMIQPKEETKTEKNPLAR